MSKLDYKTVSIFLWVLVVLTQVQSLCWHKGLREIRDLIIFA